MKDFWIYNNFSFVEFQEELIISPTFPKETALSGIKPSFSTHLGWFCTRLSLKEGTLPRVHKQCFITYFMAVPNKTSNPRRNNLFDAE